MSEGDTARRQADQLAEVGRYAEAERIVRTALARTPEDVDLLMPAEVERSAGHARAARWQALRRAAGGLRPLR